MLGQPRDRAEAMAMLERLSGRVHRVYSAVALAWDNAIALRLSKTEVSFGEITPAAMAAYWASGEPADKAGGYGIQGLGAAFVRRIEGSYSGVMGLPLYETAELLSLCGLDPLRTPPEGAEHERP
jgi:septum formation protein